MPFFSIIVPVYNIENYIRGCLDSILNQTIQDYEVLLIDDGSKDGSGVVCDEYAALYPDRFRVYHFENGGVSAARNHGLDYAQGEFVVFVDGDDVLARVYLSTFYEMIQKYATDVDVVACGILINNKNIIFGGDETKNGLMRRESFIETLPERRGIRGFLCNKAFRRSVITEHTIRLDEASHMCEDLLFCLAYARYMRCAAFENKPNYDYVQRTDSAVNLKFNPRRISVLQTYEKALAVFMEIGNERAIARAKLNYLVHHVNVFMMVRRHKEYKMLSRVSSRHIRNNVSLILNRELEMKGKIKALIAYLLSIFY